jgi:hypothetical protein
MLDFQSVATARYEFDGASAVSVSQVDATQNLAPIYEQLGDAFSHAKNKVIVAKVDADGAGKPLGQKYGVSGFPSAFPWLVLRIQRAHSNSFKMVRCSRIGFTLRRRSGSRRIGELVRYFLLIDATLASMTLFSALRRTQVSSQTSNLLPLPRRSSSTLTLSMRLFS